MQGCKSIKLIGFLAGFCLLVQGQGFLSGATKAPSHGRSGGGGGQQVRSAGGRQQAGGGGNKSVGGRGGATQSRVESEKAAPAENRAGSGGQAGGQARSAGNPQGRGETANKAAPVEKRAGSGDAAAGHDRTGGNSQPQPRVPKGPVKEDPARGESGGGSTSRGPSGAQGGAGGAGGADVGGEIIVGREGGGGQGGDPQDKRVGRVERPGGGDNGQEAGRGEGRSVGAGTELVRPRERPEVGSDGSGGLVRPRERESSGIQTPSGWVLARPDDKGGWYNIAGPAIVRPRLEATVASGATPVRPRDLEEQVERERNRTLGQPGQDVRRGVEVPLVKGRGWPIIGKDGAGHHEDAAGRTWGVHKVPTAQPVDRVNVFCQKLARRVRWRMGLIWPVVWRPTVVVETGADCGGSASTPEGDECWYVEEEGQDDGEAGWRAGYEAGLQAGWEAGWEAGWQQAWEAWLKAGQRGSMGAWERGIDWLYSGWGPLSWRVLYVAWWWGGYGRV